MNITKMYYLLRACFVYLVCYVLVACQNTSLYPGSDAATVFAETIHTSPIALDTRRSQLLEDLLLAEIALRRRYHQNAYLRYLNIVDRSQDPRAYATAYALAMQVEDFDGAYQLATDWVHHDPESVRPKRALALVALQRGEIEAVLSTLIDLEERGQNDLDRQFIALYNEHNLLPNEQTIENVINHKPPTARRHLWLTFLTSKLVGRLIVGGEFMKANRLLAAAIAYQAPQEEQFTTLLDAYKQDLYIHQMQLQILLNGSPDLAGFEAVLARNRQYHTLRYRLAEQYSLLINQGDEKKADYHLRVIFANSNDATVNTFERALLLASSLQIVLPYHTFINALPARNETQRARKRIIEAALLSNQYHYERAIPILGALHNQGYGQVALPRLIDALYKSKQIARAREMISSAVVNHSLTGILFQASLLHNIEQYSASQKKLDAWLADRPKQGTVSQEEAESIAQLYVLYTSNQFFLGHFDEMIKVIDDQLARYPDNPILLNSFGFMLTEAKRQLPRAELLITKALKQEPNNAAYIDSLGWVAYQQGRYQQAASELLKSYRLLPNPETGAHLAAAYRKIGKGAIADRLIRRIKLTDKTSRFLRSE